MSIVRWKPFDFQRDYYNDVPASDLQMKRGNDFAVDMSEDDKSVYVEIHMPGINPGDLEVSVSGHQLRVAGARKGEKESKGKTYHRKEIRYGEFEQMVMLPASVNEDKAEAEYDQGVLRFKFPKKEKSNLKKIKIKKK
jgi:HSP20 family protein